MTTNTISTAQALRWIGLFALVLAIGTVLSATLVYTAQYPDFSIFHTYLSDIGDTPGWPQILFNSGTLLTTPIRYLILVLLVLRLRSFSKNLKLFNWACLSIGALSTIGTALMTAFPFSVAPTIHKSGIGLYFLGVVFLQLVIGTTEWRLKQLPRLLPTLSFSIVICYLIFFVLFILLETGFVDRSTPVFWEWMCFFSSMVWLAAHSIILGKEDQAINSA